MSLDPLNVGILKTYQEILVAFFFLFSLVNDERDSNLCMQIYVRRVVSTN